MSKKNSASQDSSGITKLHVEEGLADGTYLVKEKTGVSDVWVNFSVVVKAISEELIGFVQCHKCEGILKHSASSGNSALKRHMTASCSNKENNKQAKKAAALKKKVTKLCVEMCGKDNRPFNVVDGAGFKKLAQEFVEIGATHGRVDVAEVIPRPSTVSRNVAAVAEDLRKKIIPAVRTAMREGRCACTTDMWTDKHSSISYSAVTAHYIDDWTMKNVLLLLNDFPVDHKHTGENILEEIELGLSSVGISPDEIIDVPFVTDEGANMKKAFESLRRLSCFAHNLNTVLRNTFEADFLRERTPTVYNCITSNRKAVKFVKQSNKAALLENSVHPFLSTRFNSLYRNLKSTFDQYVEFVQLLERSGKAELAAMLDYNTMEELLTFLDKFRMYIEKVQDNKKPTLCLVVPAFLDLVRHCQPDEEDSEEMAVIRKKALGLLNEKVDLQKEHHVTTFLVPSLRQLKGLTSAEQAKTKRWAREMCATVPTSSDSAAHHSHYFSFPGWEQNDQDVDEVALYDLLGKPDGSSDDVLAWWKCRENTFPRLAQVARRLLAIPSTSCESERTFSRSGAILTNRRSTTGSRNVGDLVFLAANSDALPEDFEVLSESDERAGGRN